MKKIGLSVLVLLVTGIFSVSYGQVETPSIADNATPVDNNIKLRSVELERIKREAEKTATIRREDGKELNFAIVKDDFEGIQKQQAMIIDAYQKSDEIDYSQISKSSNKITEMATRLRGNVFLSEEDSKNTEGSRDKETPFSGKGIRDLIIALDNAIGDVVLSPMWQKLAVLDPEESKTVEANLNNVINASNALWIESKKLKSK